MTDVDPQARAVADAIGALLKVAGEQTQALSNVGMVIIVSANSFKGTFSAEIGRILPAEVPEEKPAEAPAEAPEPEEGGPAKPEAPTATVALLRRFEFARLVV